MFDPAVQDKVGERETLVARFAGEFNVGHDAIGITVTEISSSDI